MMEAYANILLIAIPAFSVLVIGELCYKIFLKKIKVNHLDLLSSLSSGITNVTKDTLSLAVILISYVYLLETLSFTSVAIKATWVNVLISFIVYDFAGYWNHRLTHKVNIFWNRHVIHHSSEEFNLSCALRQPISEWVSFFAVFLLPAAMLGVPAEIISIVGAVHLFLQFWYHTEHIPKLGFLEYIIVTPSQHRVHHAMNPEYIDKNLAPIFCIWDRLFGTFQEELDDVPPVYGVLKPVQTWNPFKINFQHAVGIFRDAWNAKRLSDKIKIWFMPTGWRPEELQRSMPIKIVEDVYQHEKYDKKPSKLLVMYSYLQMNVTGLLLLFLFYNFANIASNYSLLLAYGVFIFVSIYGYTSVMDEEKSGLVIEFIKSAVGICIIVMTGDWFGANLLLPGAIFLILGYFALTITGSFVLSNEFKSKASLA
jgi:alkylglycerol monooxygenase